MRTSTIRGFWLHAACLALTCAHGATGAMIEGRVVDPWSADRGIAAAVVVLRFDGDQVYTNAVLTGRTGKYTVRNVAPGKYRLVVRKVGYTPNPHDEQYVAVGTNETGSVGAPAVELYRSEDTDNYYADGVRRLLREIDERPNAERAAALRHAWNSLRDQGVLPAVLRRVAVELDRERPGLKEDVPDIEAYLKSDPKAIDKAEAAVDGARDGIRLPGPDTVHDIRPEVVGDVFRSGLRSLDDPARASAIEAEFRETWKTSPAATRRLDAPHR